MEPVEVTPVEVAELLAAAEAEDGFPALSEHKESRATTAAPDARVGAWSDGSGLVAVGVAAFHRGAAAWTVEVAVHPRARHHDREAVELAYRLVPAGAPATIWARRPGQAAALEDLGLRAVRELLLLERPLPGPTGSLPEETSVRSYRAADATALVTLNNRAFAGHPEQGEWTLAELQERTRRSWFDPRDLLVVEDRRGLAGFCWTKPHPEAAGEIYVVAVDPARRGAGLGRALVLLGLEHLHRRHGARRGILWVDGENAPARGLYRSLGFRRVRSIVAYAPGGGAATQPKR